MIEYTGEVRSRTADLTNDKLLFNITVSKPGARFMCCDNKTIYLGTPTERYEYIWLRLAPLPEDIVEQYKLTTFAKYGWVYAEIRQGMYRLNQAGRISNDYPSKNIVPHGEF